MAPLAPVTTICSTFAVIGVPELCTHRSMSSFFVASSLTSALGVVRGRTRRRGAPSGRRKPLSSSAGDAGSTGDEVRWTWSIGVVGWISMPWKVISLAVLFVPPVSIFIGALISSSVMKMKLGWCLPKYFVLFHAFFIGSTEDATIPRVNSFRNPFATFSLAALQ